MRGLLITLEVQIANNKITKNKAAETRYIEQNFQKFAQVETRFNFTCNLTVNRSQSFTCLTDRLGLILKNLICKYL